MLEELDSAEHDVATLVKRLRAAVEHYNSVKSHEYYVPLPKLTSIKSRRTGRENLRIISVYIPSTRVPETLEYVHLVTYITREKVMKKQHFNMRYDFTARTLKHIINSLTPRGVANQHHAFIYFIGWGFRAGAHEEVKQTNAKYKDRGIDWRVTLVELRYGSSLYPLVVKDLSTYLGARALKLLESVSERNQAIFSRPKHFVDYVLFILAYLSRNEHLVGEVEDLARRYEVLVKEYVTLFAPLPQPVINIEERGR